MKTIPRQIAFLILCSTVILSIGTAPAEVIASFIDGTSGDPNMPAAAAHPNVTTSEVDNTAFTSGPVRDNWVGTQLGGHWITSAHNGTNPADIGESATNDEVIAASGYSWTITAAPDFRIGLSSVTIDFGIVAQLASQPTDWGYRLFLSIDGGAFVSVGSDSASDELPAATFSQKDSGNFAASGTTITGGSVTLKLVDWGKVSANNNQFGSSANTFRNITLDGTVSPNGEIPGELGITSVSHDPDAGTITIHYRNSYAGGADIYYSDDLISWVADGSEPSVGTNLELSRATPTTSRFYILVEPGAPFPTP